VAVRSIPFMTGAKETVIVRSLAGLPVRYSYCDLGSWVLWRRTGLRTIGAAHIIEYGLALLIDKAGK
jgi:hypothetical protein